jgi:hypothetical protein
MTVHELNDGVVPAIDDIHVSRADEDGRLRAFDAIIKDADADDGRTIGEVRGLIAWRSELFSLLEAGDEISGEAATLALAADQIREADYRPGAEDQIGTVVMVELVSLGREFRGHRIAAAVIDQIIDLLVLDPITTLVVLEPEPQKEDGGPLPPGAQRTAALKRLRAAYEQQGFERWKNSTVWWAIRPVPGLDGEL